MTAFTAAVDVDLDHHYRIHTGGTDPADVLTIGHTDRWSVHYLGRVTPRGRRVWLLYDPGQIKGLIVLVPSPADPLVQRLCAGGWHQVAALPNRQVLVRRRPPQRSNSTGPSL